MEEISLDEANKKYDEYIEAGLKMFPPFKGFGMKFVQFAIDEPEMFRLLHMQNDELPYNQFIDRVFRTDKVLPYVCASLELNETDARWLFHNMCTYAYGLGVMFANSSCVMTEEEIGRALGGVFRGLLMELKAPADERIAMMPSENPVNHGSFEEYVKGKKNVIIGYGEDREMFQIRLDAVYYFEAVGENVFAYTKANVYEIKQRLYQVEEAVKAFSFERASKSLLVNLKKVMSVAPDSGGRKSIKLINGECVIASRAYCNNVEMRLKESVD